MEGGRRFRRPFRTNFILVCEPGTMCRANFLCRSAAFFASRLSLDNPICPAQSQTCEK
jgi:hypothetical protein